MRTLYTTITMPPRSVCCAFVLTLVLLLAEHPGRSAGEHCFQRNALYMQPANSTLPAWHCTAQSMHKMQHLCYFSRLKCDQLGMSARKKRESFLYIVQHHRERVFRLTCQLRLSHLTCNSCCECASTAGQPIPPPRKDCTPGYHPCSVETANMTVSTMHMLVATAQMHHNSVIGTSRLRVSSGCKLQ
jgi:hypothetical protein